MMDQKQILDEIDKAMTEVDLLLWEWTTANDMMSFTIGEATSALLVYINNIPLEDPVITTPAKRPVLNVMLEGQWVPIHDQPKELPLVRYEGTKRIEIGTATLNDDGSFRAIVNHDAAGFVSLPDPSEYSFFTEPVVLPEKKWWAARVSLPSQLKEI
jgi:hypothetical protein